MLIEFTGMLSSNKQNFLQRLKLTSNIMLHNINVKLMLPED
jgi:hypothetical protein